MCTFSIAKESQLRGLSDTDISYHKDTQECGLGPLLTPVHESWNTFQACIRTMMAE